MKSPVKTIQHTFSLDAGEGYWRLLSPDDSDLRLGAVWMAVYWRSRGRAYAWHGTFDPGSLEIAKTADGPFGKAISIRAEGRTSSYPVRITAKFLLHEGHPLFLWRMKFCNLSSVPCSLERMTLFQTADSRRRSSYIPQRVRRGAWPERSYDRLLPALHGGEGWAFYNTGWQSWTYAGTLSPNQRMPRTRLGFLTAPVQINKGTELPRRKGVFSSDMFGVVGSRIARKGLLAGFLSQRQGFGAFDVRFHRRGAAMWLWLDGDDVRIDPGSDFESDWACIQFVDLDASDPLGAYLDAVGSMNGARTTGTAPVGWCSWYQYFQKVTEEDVLESVRWVQSHTSESPIDVIQIDDGYQVEVGDWLEWDARSFPSGMDQLAAEIDRAGFTPGIWMAPFIAKPESDILKSHDDWVLRRRNGRPTPAGFIWDSFPRALDVTHPDVREYVRRVIQTAVEDWGYRYLKLDFLYAGALPGSRFDPTKTRAQALRGALELIRESAGEHVILVGCGCPLGSGVGIFDAMRVGPDVAPHWDPQYRNIGFLLRKEPGIPALRAALQTSLSRANLHRRWWINDVDCLLLRQEDTTLIPAEVQTLATVVALSGGTMMVSDDLSGLSKERITWLQRLLPPLPGRVQVVDWFDAARPTTLVLPLEGAIGKWWLIAVINWEDEARDLGLDLSSLGLDGEMSCHGVDFWQQTYVPIFEGRLLLKGVPAHGVRLVGIRGAVSEPQWVGDTLHVSQGLGIGEWTPTESGLKLNMDYGRSLRGRAWLQLPAEPAAITLKGEPQSWRCIDLGLFAVDLDALEGGELLVRWK